MKSAILELGTQRENALLEKTADKDAACCLAITFLSCERDLERSRTNDE